MPIFDFRCACGLEREEIVRDSEEIVTCACGSKMAPHTVVRFAVVGPVFSGMEDMERAVLGPTRMRRGERFRGAADIERFERDNGLSRSSAAEIRHFHDQNHEEALTVQRVEREGGSQGVADYTLKKEITEKTGWGDSQYNRWKEHTDVAAAAAERDPSLVA